ncbi:(3S)-malyl-CoA thioesterase [Paracoccus thiocyanatus]|uniref:(3S)-malyl-CoA thioesterase n=1 Tax=Paracoccus thiocyanatus TaxID=34006 RepID=A0A1N6U783_9RHOB|nr:thioesterase family protein [Paracoccus thiocyanatus]SIQ61485.1 (3S)-malyl-CoA thioesterase [Paracoccus thiocyanatus]
MEYVPVSTWLAHQWQCDHFGHMNARHYAAAFDDAVFLFWDRMGLVVPGPGEAGVIPVTARLTIDYHLEVVAGTALNILARIDRIGGKSVTVGFEMRESRTGRPVSTCETVEVFFDAVERQSRPIPAPIREALQRAASPVPPR